MGWPHLWGAGVRRVLLSAGAADGAAARPRMRAAPIAGRPAGARARLARIGDLLRRARQGHGSLALVEGAGGGGQAADADEPPKRLLLGSDAYSMVRSALTERLELVHSQRELARSADVSRPGAAATIVTAAGRVGELA